MEEILYTDERMKIMTNTGIKTIAGSGNHDETIGGFIVQGLNEAFGIEIQ